MKTSVLKLVLAATVFAFVASAPDCQAAIGKKKKASKEPEKKEAPAPAPKKKQTPYEKLMKDVSETADGGFLTLYKTKKEKIYAGLPVSLIGRRILAAGTVSSISDPSTVKVGYKYAAPLCLQIERMDSLIVLQSPSRAASADAQYAKAMERNYTPEIYKVIPFTFSKDSSSVIFEITSLVNSLSPKDKGFAASKASGEGKTSWIGQMKSFSDNASVVLHSNVDFFRSVLGFKVNLGSGSMTSTISFMLLPEQLMKPRVQDARIGVFSTTGVNGNPKYLLADGGDGFRAYRLANRWRLEPVDTAAWLAGQKVAVKKPIVWYVDDAFPQSWREPIRKGVLEWNAAFEKIGLKDVMQVRDFPTKDEDPQFDPDNLRYNCLRYIPNATMNAQGPSWVDPVTGEILSASVMVFNDVVRLINNWRFVQTSQVDERVRAVKMPQDVMDESLEYVIAHEVGHTLGLMHNMSASASFDTESLRDAAFTQQYGTTPSIMDYARFNYVAQPSDKGVRLCPPLLGIYDEYAIDWLYRPVPEAKNMWEEAKIASKAIDAKGDDPRFRYGAQQISTSSTGVYDPTAMAEDLGNDPVKSSDYGIANLKYILSNMNVWLGADSLWSHKQELYAQMCSQYMRYLNNVLMQVGGIRLYTPGPGSNHLPAEPLEAGVQSASVKWVIGQIRSCGWLDDKTLTQHFTLGVPYPNRIVQAMAGQLVREVPERVQLCASIAGGKAYGMADYYYDLYQQAFASSEASRKLSSVEKTLQRELVLVCAKPLIAQRNKTSLVDEDECFCSHCLGDEVGEGKDPYQKLIDTKAIDEVPSYNALLLSKIGTLAGRLRKSGPAEDRAHYEYLYKTITATDK